MNRKVLISGGTSGIGLAIAKKFIEEKDHVILASRSREKFLLNFDEETSAVDFYSIDFGEIDQVKELYDQIRKNYGVLDIAVNNVGGSPLKPFSEYTESEYDYIHNVNLKGLWLSLKNQLSLMTHQKPRNKFIINISSINGLGGAENLSLYSATKAGMIALTKSIALEYANSHISVNSIVPGPFETPMLNSLLEDQAGGNHRKAEEIAEQYKRMIPRQRFGKPEEIANLVNWICSGESLYMTGHSFIIDGGLSSRFR